jgi:hypothetical protein
LVPHPTFCGQDSLDIQVRIFYSLTMNKQCLIKCDKISLTYNALFHSLKPRKSKFLSKKLSNQTNKRWRKKYVSLNLVYSYWTNLGGYREIGDARAHNDVLDDRAWHHRIDHRRRPYPHVRTPDKRTISSRRTHFFHTGRDPGSLHLL